MSFGSEELRVALIAKLRRALHEGIVVLLVQLARMRLVLLLKISLNDWNRMF